MAQQTNLDKSQILAARAKMATDFKAGNVPEFDRSDKAKAQAFVDYINSLTTEPTVTLVESITYSFIKIKPE